MSVPDPTNTLKLIEAAREGDADAWNQLYVQSLGILITVASKINKRRYDPDDVRSWMDECFIRCVRNFDPDNGSQFSHYLWTSCERARKKAYVTGPIHVPIRERGSHRFSYTEIYHRECPEDDPEELGDIEDYHINDLSSMHRDIVHRKMHGDTYVEIGRDYGVSRQYIHQEYVKAINHLKTLNGA